MSVQGQGETFRQLKRNLGLRHAMDGLSILSPRHCFLSTTILCSRPCRCCGIMKGKAHCRTVEALKCREKLSALDRITIGS